MRHFQSSLLFVALYICALGAGFALYIGAFAADLFARWPILFYRGIPIAFLVAALLFMLLVMLRGTLWEVRDAVGAVAASLAFNLCFLVLFPVTIDRSISVFLLAQMDRQPGHVFTSAELEARFVRVYLGDWRQIDRRMREQIASGNIESAGKGYRISPQGRRFIHLARKAQKLFGTDSRFVGADARK